MAIEDIVADIQRSNNSRRRELLEKLIEQIYDDLRRHLCYSSLGLAPEEQEDVLHDALYKILEKIDTYDRSKASFLTWCKTIVRNTGIDYRKKKRPNEDLEIIDELHSQNSNSRNFEAALIERLTFAGLQPVIEEVLAGQPAHYKMAYELSLQGYAPREIAKHMNLKPRQVTDVLHRLKHLVQKVVR